METQAPQLKGHYKLWLSLQNGDGIMGDGKWLLLESIQETGSISHAAQKLNISYRKAWGDIKKAEELLGVSLIIKARGGSAGGGSTLSEQGKKLVKAYSRFHKHFDKAFHKSFEKFLHEISVASK